MICGVGSGMMDDDGIVVRCGCWVGFCVVGGCGEFGGVFVWVLYGGV